MKITIQKQIGRSVVKFETEEAKGRDALFTAGFLSSTPDTCGLCGSKEVNLEGNKAKGYTFVKVICTKCYGRAEMGEYKDGGYFWKKWEKFEKNDGVSESDMGIDIDANEV